MLFKSRYEKNARLYIFALFSREKLHQHTIKPPCLQLPSGQTGTQFTFGFPGSPSFNTVRPVCILSISFTTRHFVCLFVFLPLYVSHPPSADNQHQISESCGFRPHRHTVPVSDRFHFHVRAASWKLPHGGFTLARVAFKGRQRERNVTSFTTTRVGDREPLSRC